jgi:hypothetical protein
MSLYSSLHHSKEGWVCSIVCSICGGYSFLFYFVFALISSLLSFIFERTFGFLSCGFSCELSRGKDHFLDHSEHLDQAAFGHDPSSSRFEFI